jgi:hypothetical protein
LGEQIKEDAFSILMRKPKEKGPTTPLPLPLPKYNDAVIAVNWNSYLRFHICLISAFYKQFVAYISPNFQHTFQGSTMNTVTPTSEVQMDTKMVLLMIRSYTHDSGVDLSGIPQISQNS